MPDRTCANEECGEHFYSKHSTARFCSRSCAGIANAKLLLPGSRRKYSDAYMLQALVSEYDRTGKTPSKRSIKLEGLPDLSIYRHRFGSWTNAVTLAGLTPNIPIPSSVSDRFVSLNTRYKILKRDRFRCQSCGGTPELGYVLQVDHITPLSKGGETVEDNLRTLCWMCNSGKSDT
jgi:transposase-like protein